MCFWNSTTDIDWVHFSNSQICNFVFEEHNSKCNWQVVHNKLPQVDRPSGRGHGRAEDTAHIRFAVLGLSFIIELSSQNLVLHKIQYWILMKALSQILEVKTHTCSRLIIKQEAAAAAASVVEEYQNYYNPTMIMRSNCWWI